MGFFKWFFDLTGVFRKEDKNGMQVEVRCQDLIETISMKNLAINSAINLIGNSIALSEFNTYQKGKEVKENDYYALNIEPNPNYSASRFWKKFIWQLVYNNECLIIMYEDNYYVADSFVKHTLAFKDNYYTDITVDDFSMKRSYQEKDVLYFTLNENRVRSLVDGLYQDYGKLVEYAKASYKKNNAKRGILNIPANYPNTPDAQAKLQKLLNEHLKTFYNAENGAVLPLTNGITYEDISSDSYKNATDSRDIRNLINDVFDFVAIAFQIPPALLKGSSDELESTVDRYIKLCIEPMCELIEDECNRKIYSKSQYLDNTYISIDTTKLKIANINNLATTIDILSRNGVHNIDENRKLIGKEPLRTKESQERRITKNYESFENL